MVEQTVEAGPPRDPMHNWIIVADFLFQLLERITVLAAIYALGLLLKNPIVLWVYAISTMALIFATQANLLKIARDGGAYHLGGWSKIVMMALLFALLGLISFGVPHIVKDLAKLTNDGSGACK